MKTMTKKNVLKLAMMVMATFMFTAVMGQLGGDPDDYGLITDDGSTSYVTLDATIPFYVTPDPMYHPSWTAISNGLTAGFVWNFTDSADPSEWTDGTELTLNVTNNYVEITANTVGTYGINVKEQAPMAFGGCEDPIGRDFTIVVTGKPTAEFEGTNNETDNDWDEIVAGHEYIACGSQDSETIIVTITEDDAPVALQQYAYRVQRRVVILDELDVEVSVVSTDNIIDHTIETKGLTSSITTGPLNVLDYEWDIEDGPVPSRTLYEFTLAPATDALAGITGIISTISHKSDYLALFEDITDFTNYVFTGTTVIQYVVNPAPVTGPIYHIPNDFNL